MAPLDGRNTQVPCVVMKRSQLVGQETTPGRLRSMFSRRGLLKAAGTSAAGAAVASVHGGALNPKDTEPIVLAQEDESEMTHTATCDPDRAYDQANAVLPDNAEPWHSGNM